MFFMTGFERVFKSHKSAISPFLNKWKYVSNIYRMFLYHFRINFTLLNIARWSFYNLSNLPFILWLKLINNKVKLYFFHRFKHHLKKKLVVNFDIRRYVKNKWKTFMMKWYVVSYKQKKFQVIDVKRLYFLANFIGCRKKFT